MSTLTVTPSADAEIDDGASASVAVLNSGAFPALVQPWGILLRPGQRGEFQPEGQEVKARSQLGTTTLTVTATAPSVHLIGLDGLGPDVIDAIDGAAGEPADTDLAALALIDTTQSGVAATDGTGWALKPYATLRAAIGAAPLASPALTGTPTAPTAAPGTNTTQLATTAHAAAGDAAVVGGAPAWMDTLAKISTSIDDDPAHAATVAAALALKAPLASPTFTGTPAVPTATAGTNTTQAASTAYVVAAIAALIASAPGALDTLKELADAINDDASFVATMTTALAGKQPLNAALTAIAGLSPADGDLIRRWAGSYISQPITSVKADMGLDNVTNTSDANKPVSTAQQTALDLKANLASPALTGTPTAPTASAGTNTTQIATTAHVQAAVAALVNSAPGTLDTLAELATALGSDPSFATTITNALALKAPLASPTLTGTPAVPTAATATNTTQAASTAFVQTELTTAVGRGFRAADQGYVSWAYDTAFAQNSSTPTGGSVYLVKLLVPVAVSVTKIKWWVATVGSGATASSNWVGLYNSAGTKLADANVDGDITSTGVKTTTISSQNLSAGFVWVALLFNASGLPAIARSTSLSGAGTNDGLTAATFRHGINGTSRATLIDITPSSNTNGTAYWAAIAA